MIKLSEIAKEINGEIVGDDCYITGVSSINNAKNGDITFLFTRKFIHIALNSSASAFIVTEDTKLENKNQIVVKNPSLAQAKVLKLFYRERKKVPFISENAYIGRNVVIGKDVTVMDYAYISSNAQIGDETLIYPFVYIGEGVKIGKRVKIFPHVVVMDYVEIGDDSIIHPGVVIGADGFGYAFNGNCYEKIPQVGKVIIGNSVEIGANTTIDRATLDSTVIEDGSKLDNLVMIGHNVSIGKNTIIAGQTGIAGSSKIGNYVIMGGQVGIVDHVKIGNNVMIAGKTGIMSDIEDGKKIAGIPARDYKTWLKIQAYLEKLPEIKKTLDVIMKKIQEEEGDKDD